MEELLNLGRAKAGSNVKGNIDKFETLSLTESANKPRSNSSKSKRSIVDLASASSIDENSMRDSLDTAPSFKSKASSATSMAVDLPVKEPKKRESVAFVQKSYLEPTNTQNNYNESLPDDAREILKSQPDYEDLLAVLQYLECGVQEKHDFNIHVTGPKQSQIINALVTVTVPDHWPVLRIHKLPKRQDELKKLLVLILRSVAGIGALLLQIRNLGSIQRSDTTVLEDTICVLELVLHGSQFLHNMLRQTRKLYAKETSRRITWQEIIAAVSGSKILSTVAQSTSSASIQSSKSQWMSDGIEYSKWLARNVSVTAGLLILNDGEAWTMLALVVKRALNLGYRGKFDRPSF